MRTRARRLWGWWRALGSRRAQLVAWVVFGTVIVFALVRVEATADEAHANAVELRRLVERLETERVDRCTAGRGDTRRAIVRVVDEFTDLSDPELQRLSEVVEDEIPTVACTRPPP